MNITDIKDSEISVPDSAFSCLTGIFARQEELHEKYKHVEHGNGLGLHLIKDKKFSLDCPRCQYIIKDFAWRVTEELTEALEAHHDGNELHCVEEIIDALHFYTELLILCGYDARDIDLSLLHGCDSESILMPIYPVGLACNLLKNKPWKNTHLITDEKRFKEFITIGYIDLLSLAISRGLDHIENVYMVYMKKNLVNKFRIESNY